MIHFRVWPTSGFIQRSTEVKRIESACSFFLGCNQIVKIQQAQTSRVFSISRLFSTLCSNKLSKKSENFVAEEKKKDEVMKVLSVAEKNDAAKRIAQLLSNGTAQTRNSFSVYNKLYQFQYTFQNQRCEMTMTSVSGHLLNYEFDNNYRKWHSCDPVELFEAPMRKACTENMKDIKRTLEQQAAYHQVLIIWTDCDREGENIGYEVITVCQAVNPRLQIYRAKFSEITKVAIVNAMGNLIQPDKRISDAVDVRQQLDLRIGAAFTRFQTLRLSRKFAELADRLISYGSCQFPTLGFVVERYKAVQDFISEPFWKIDVTHKKDDLKVVFHWARVRLFDQLAVQSLYEECLDDPMAKVIKVQRKRKNKWRPVALDTIEFEKIASKKLRIGAKEAMQIAEQLYTSGYISYPRTETNIFPPSLNLTELVEQQTTSPTWGGFATRLLQSGINPRNGKKSDQAHPPIHPTKFHNLQGLSEKHKKVYELVARHFLACCSKDAVGNETIVEIEIADEKFVASGLTITERNYLEVYIYDKWSDKELPEFREGETFRPTTIEMNEGKTDAPNLLTEADLIALMEKHGIGTDATHAEHIETIKQRQYVGLDGVYFVPGKLGMGLVEGYDAMGFEMSKPYLRSQLESDLQKICEGTKRPDVVLAEQIRNYKEVFIQARDQVNRLDEAMSRLLNDPGGGNRRDGPNHGGGGGGNVPPGGPNRNRRNDDDNDDDDDGNDRRPPVVAARIAPSSRFNSSANVNNHSRQTPSLPSQQQRSGINPNYGNDENSGENVTCSCGSVPNILTTRKEGPNFGRQFYKCDTCGFFKWVDAQVNNQSRSHGMQTSNAMPPPPVPPSRQQKNHMNRTDQRSQHANVSIQPPPQVASGGNSVGIILCHCNKPAGSYTVRKEGINKGRKFFGCTIPFGVQENRCDFFKWDESFVPQNSDTEPAGSSRGRGGGGGGQRRPRRCGICHQQGHTRRNCPLAGGDEDEEEMDCP